MFDVNKAIEYMQSIKPLESVLIVHTLAEKLAEDGIIGFRDENEEGGPCIYWTSTGESILDGEPPIGPCYYFGCSQVHDEQGSKVWADVPFRWQILDAGLLPPKGQHPEGKANLCHIGQWTVVTFWDRTHRGRHNANSSFVIPAVLDFDSAIALSKVRFPWVWKHLTFEVTQY